MADPALDLSARYTYRDYRSWPDDERWELIRGEAWMMGAPTTTHQRLSRILIRMLEDALPEGGPCEAFYAPVDVLLPDHPDQDDDAVRTVVQPDLLVVCDPRKVGDKFVLGAPELVMEILSPSTSGKDQHEKRLEYERSGVREYWVLDPAGAWLARYLRGGDGRFGQPEIRERGAYGPIASDLVPALVIDPAALFASLAGAAASGARSEA